MKFSTQVVIEQNDLVLDYSKNCFCMGSCFSDEIGKFLLDHKFTTTNNILGISFNPISISKQLNFLFDNKQIEASELQRKDDYFVHFDFHGNFSRTNEKDLKELLNKKLNLARASLLKADILFITLGTSFVFKHKQQNRIVNNCHKIDQNQFDRILLTTKEIEDNLAELIDGLNLFNPKLKTVFTVSPIRHIRDGLIANQRSKANLISAVQNVIDKNSNCFYFPSYEIMLDELRDYRYYKEDMIHPTEQAIKYILERFLINYVRDEDFDTVKKVSSIKKQFAHKVLKPGSSLHYDFLIGLKANVKKMMQAYPKLNFSQEMNQLEDSLTEFKNV